MQSETKYVTLVSVGFRKIMFAWFPSINSDGAPFEATPLCVADRTLRTGQFGHHVISAQLY